MESNGRTILLAEDNPLDIELTLAAFQEHGLTNEIVVARDGVEALDYLYRRNQYAGWPAGHPLLRSVRRRGQADRSVLDIDQRAAGKTWYVCVIREPSQQLTRHT